MCAPLKLLRIAAVAAAINVSSGVCLATEEKVGIVISDVEIPASEILEVRNLIGFYDFPLTAIAQVAGEDPKMAVNLVMTAVSYNPVVAYEGGIDTKEFSKLGGDYSGIWFTEYRANFLADAIKLKLSDLKQRPVFVPCKEFFLSAQAVPPSDCINSRLINTSYLTALVGSELFSVDGHVRTGIKEAYVVRSGSKRPFYSEVNSFVLNKKVFGDLVEVHRVLKQEAVSKHVTELDAFKKAERSLSKYPGILRAIISEFPPVTFGRPNVYTSQEAELTLPRSITVDRDVYYVEFAFSLRDVSDDYVKIEFSVSLPDSAIAYELIPLRFGAEMTVEREMKSPTLEAEKIKIGEFFRQTVSFKTLKPTVVGSGLQEPRFSWLLSDDAVGPGAVRFAAIIGVPKGLRAIPVGYEVKGHVSKLMGLIADKVSSGTVLHTINLPN